MQNFNSTKRAKFFLPLAALLFGGMAILNAHAATDEIPVAARGNMYHHAVETGIEQAKASLDDARARYFAQLYVAADFFCAIRIADNSGTVEQVFVKVGNWGERITGVIANNPAHVRGYARGDAITFDSSDIMDWAIRFNDGRVEGNFVAKSLRHYGLG